MVLTTSKEQSEVDSSIGKGHVINQTTDGQIEKWMVYIHLRKQIKQEPKKDF